MKLNVLTGKLAQEYKTVSHMLQIYCKAHCGDVARNGGLCQQCSALVDYAEQKLDRCPYGETKPDCGRCPIHCYKPEPREQIREAMRYAGPRMMLYHPIEALLHLIDTKRSIPEKPPVAASQMARRKAAQRAQKEADK